MDIVIFISRAIYIYIYISGEKCFNDLYLSGVLCEEIWTDSTTFKAAQPMLGQVMQVRLGLIMLAYVGYVRVSQVGYVRLG